MCPTRRYERGLRSPALHAQPTVRTSYVLDRRLRLVLWLGRLLRDEFAVEGICEALSIELAPLSFPGRTDDGYRRCF